MYYNVLFGDLLIGVSLKDVWERQQRSVVLVLQKSFPWGERTKFFKKIFKIQGDQSTGTLFYTGSLK